MTTPSEALRTILPIADWGDTQAADVMFTGGADPVLSTPFHIGAAGAATLAASELAATELWQVRGGRKRGTPNKKTVLRNAAISGAGCAR
jgi:hypothetical protein